MTTTKPRTIDDIRLEMAAAATQLVDLAWELAKLETIALVFRCDGISMSDADFSDPEDAEVTTREKRETSVALFQEAAEDMQDHANTFIEKFNEKDSHANAGQSAPATP